MAGFECSDHLNRSGIRINLRKTTEHDIRVSQDYQLLNNAGISVAREGICWSEVEKEPYSYDFSRLIPFYKAAEEYGIQIIWDLCHFGFPDDLFPTHPQFSNRFKALAEEFCLFHRSHSSQPLWVIPINEISFLAWFGGENKGTVPYTTHTGWEMKYHLCKAAIQGIHRIKEILPNSIILLAEPLIKVHSSEKDGAAAAREKHAYQYQAADMILGRICPELGGSENLLDFLGVNYYFNNQWNDKDETLIWPDPEKKRMPFSELLTEVYKRYKIPMLITETGHMNDLRIQWIQEIIQETEVARDKGVDLRGICLYPIIDRPDWDDLTDYHHTGIWELDAKMDRIPVHSFLKTIKRFAEFYSDRKKKKPA